MTLDYISVILNQFLDNASLIYLSSIKLDAIYKLEDIGGEKLAK